jgi:enoyl-CoA hydratase/carnithine racemase
MGNLVRLEVEDAVGTIRLDRPRANAINLELLDDLRAAAEEATSRDDVRAVVLWGGPSIFAAGADVKMMAELGSLEPEARLAAMRDTIGAMQDVFTMVEEIPKVTIAAINGYALGGGCELAMCADFRFAGDDATLGQPEILLGIIPGAGGTQRLPGLVGPARAKELIFSGRQVPAEEALAIGLVDRVVPAAQVYEAAVGAARGYAHGPTVALRAAKRAISAATRRNLREGLALEKEVFIDLFSTEDQKAGMRSFVEDGPGKATFSGR